MATMNISLPEAMKQWVEQQGRSGHYSNSSDYVRDLIRRDYERAVKVARLQALATEGIQSGAGTRTMAELKAAAKAAAGG
jgi:antitoxin ParD1/3/4